MNAETPHDHEKAQSYRNLNTARQKAASMDDYNSQFTRSRLTEIFRARFGAPPHSVT